jgi:YD repeat-containing protein
VRIWLAIALAACGNPTDRKLPGASITPHFTRRSTPPACGEDITFAGATTPAVRYAFSYDGFGQLAHATGVYAAGGANDEVDYLYDNLGHMMHMLESRTLGDGRYEITADYDTLGDLLDYTWEETDPSYHSLERYLYSEFTDTGQPTREVLSTSGQADVHYQLDYDASGRIAIVLADGGSTTTYSYDDAETRTITIDTDNGAVVGVIEYDGGDHELSEHWDGSDPNLIANAIDYTWTGDRLVGEVVSYGSEQAHHQLEVVETHTIRYDCN